MPKLTNDAPASGRWQQLQLDNAYIVKKYDKGTMFRMPVGSEYAGYVFFHPNSLIKPGSRITGAQADNREPCQTLLYKDDFSFVLKNDGKEINISGQQLEAELHRADTLPKYQNGREYLQNCPPSLRSERKFICLRLTWDEVKGKFSKMPINPHTGGQAQVNNPETWGSFSDACAAIDKFSINGGIGYILTGNDNIVGIDLDLDPVTHKLTANGEAILDRMKGKTYIEYSASGALHIFGFGVKPGTWTRGASDSCLEMYGSTAEGNRSLMLTGKVYDGQAIPLANIQEDVNAIYKKYFARKEVTRTSAARHKSSFDENAIIEKIRAGKSGAKFDRLMNGNTLEYGGDYSKADLALCSIIAFYTDDTRLIDSVYRQSGLYEAQKVNPETGRIESRSEKWDSRRQGGTYGEETISLAVRNVLKTYTPSGYEKVAPLMVYKQTEKAVMVKIPKTDTPAIKSVVWLPKSRIELDAEGKRVLAADKRLIDDNKLPRFVAKPNTIRK